jgi:hypothetical protein
MAKSASWSMKEFQQALRMKRQGVSCADIATALGRNRAAVEAKLNCCKKASAKVPIAHLTQGQIAPLEGQIKPNTARHRNLTATICGDPPIGHSALDRA